MQGALSPFPRRALAALALLVCARGVGALQLGEIEVRSALGDPLDARVPLTLASGEYVEGSCFSLLREPAAGAVAPLSGGILSVHTSPGGRKALRIRSAAPLTEPAYGLRVRGSCAGQSSEAVREFVVLLDPPRVQRPPATRPSRAERPAPPSRAAAPARPAGPAQASTPPRVAEAAAAKSAPAARPGPTAAPAGRSDFVLKLSAPGVDLSRSRGVDDKARARLRERQLVLDADDHVSALLELRHSVRQLETRVAELQLKLTTAPPTVIAKPAPAAKPEPPPKPSSPVKVESSIASRGEPQPAAPRLAEAPRVQVAPPEPVKAAPPEPAKAAPPEPAKPAPPPVVAPAPQPPAPTAAVAPAKPPIAAATPRPAKPAASSSWRDRLPDLPREWLYGLLALVLVLLALAILWMRRRRAAETAESAESDEPAVEEDALPEVPALVPPASPRRAGGAAIEPAVVPTAAAERSLASDAGLSTRLGENSRELRRRYIEERFPEIANRTLRLDDPASVIKAARLYYSDGALTRAVELLQFCIEDNPAEQRFWLALFEIFRLERLAGEYAALAQRFKAVHGASDAWRKVQHFGREIDPDNALYKAEPVNKLQTIGPNEARRLAKASAIDPIAENWLEAPMDFENEVLANELRRKLMARAGLTEQDLAPNTMPVLRNVNLFQVA